MLPLLSPLFIFLVNTGLRIGEALEELKKELTTISIRDIQQIMGVPNNWKKLKDLK